MPESSGLDLSRLERKVDGLSAQARQMEQKIDVTRSEVSNVKSSVDAMSKEVTALKREFEKMIEEQRKQAALQRALTELVRVRQEIQDNFGNYGTIRKTMIGILQATDAALVKKTTISNVSEELMISSPNYWLAPCLVAVAAWIGNDRALADRAIAEACKRDEERTSLVMALICRRNNRTEACYEWLSVYFANQNAAHFSEGSFIYVDAYINGVFGPDTMHMCDDYIERWLTEIQAANKNFAQDQQTVWKDYCQNYVSPVDKEYPQLKESVKEFKGINAYAERLKSVDALSRKLVGMKQVDVNQEELKESIDSRLLELVKRYNEDEAPLREEEALYQAIKKHHGDEAAAEAEVKREKQKRLDKAKDFVGQMVEAIKGGEDISESQQKTAISFLGTYIERGMKAFTEETKDQFPKQITIAVDDWKGSTEDGSNREQLKKQYVGQNEAKRQSELTAIEEKKVTSVLIGPAVAVIVGLILLFAVNPVFGLIVVAGGAISAIVAVQSFGKKKEQQIAETNGKYDELRKNGTQQIDKCVDQWLKVKNRVATLERQDRRIA